MGDNNRGTMVVNATRASSISPTLNSNEPTSARVGRPPPPVRPKPKRAITAPILISNGVGPEIRVIDDSPHGKLLTTPSLPTKGNVKALAERFEITRHQISPASADVGVSIVKSAAEIFEANNQQLESSKRPRIGVGVGGQNNSTSTLLRFPKPTPPEKYAKSRPKSSSNDVVKTDDENSSSKSSRKNESSLCVQASTDGKRGSLERHRRKKIDQGQEQRSTKKGENGRSVEAGHRSVAEKEDIYRKGATKLTRSRSNDSIFGISTAKSLEAKRRNSIDCSNYFLEAESKLKKSLIAKTTTPIKKATPPAVPPKPPKKSSLSNSSPMHEYAEYDQLPSTSPSTVFPPLTLPKKEQKRDADDYKRKSLPVDRFTRQLPETPSPISILPSQLYDSPGRFSLGTSSTPTTTTLTTTPNLATMELLNDSQLNISGHIYCAVRHGEVIEDDEEEIFIRKSIDFVETTKKNGKELAESDDDSDEPSFSAAVFDAVEMAIGKRDKNRKVDEDAVTNYEEIMEDAPTTKDETKEAKLPLPSMTQTDDKGAIDQSNKWETCSSLTSTSADSGSSSTNAHTPMLIAFRRRSSNERRSEKDESESKRTTECTLAEDDSSSVFDDDRTPTQNNLTSSYSPTHQQAEKRDSKSAPRSGARLSRQARPKSQLDLAANSLWRIKSDIQLNLSQAMGKIRLKVSSSGTTPSANGGGGPSPKSGGGVSPGTPTTDSMSTKKLDQKARSTFYLPTANTNEAPSSKNNLSKHPTSISITLEAGLGDEMASSTAASSDEDDDEEEEEEEDPGWDRTLGNEQGQVNGSEDTTLTAVSNLPDLVPKSRNQTDPATTSRSLPIFGDDDTATTTDSSSPTEAGTTVSNSSPAAGATRPPFVSETSCSSTVASGLGELERFELVYNSRFAFSEPLYQHYRSQTTMVQRNQTFSEGDGKGTISRRDKLLNTSQLGSQRTLWCELPEVQGAGLLQRMSDEERKLQEAMFEVITSEASYLRSLNILITQFMASPQLSGNTSLGSCITKQERKQLFSNILSVRDCSERLLCCLETRLEENVVLVDVCDLIHDNLRRDSEIYIKYCANQIYQERTLNDLRRTNAEFRQVVGQLETSPVCECLNLRSFLMLPMQRVTRYPLLAAAILQRTEENSQRQATAQRAYGIAGRVVRQCNEGAKRLERIEQLVELDQTLLYREGGPKRLAFVSGSRWLIKKGALVHLMPRRHTLGVRSGLRHRRVYLFLFTDLLLITKPVENDRRFVVKDYCQRQFVEVAPLEPSCPQVPEGSNLPSNSHLILCTLMKNHRGRQVQLVMNCETETDKTRWLEAVRPTSSQEDGDERIYEPWDCPQVRVVNEYRAVQEDELELEVGEIINVLRKMPDGWYEGERLRDGEKGWFPGYLTEEILSDHIRAKNYRDRLRFINEAELIQRSILMGDTAAAAPSLSLPSSSMTGTNSRRSSMIPIAAKSLFRF